MIVEIFGMKLRVELLILIAVITYFICIQTFCSVHGGVKEAFQVSKDLTGSALNYVMGKDVKSSWTYNTETSDTSSHYERLYQPLEHNTGGEVPLPEGQLFMFYQNKNSADCCPSSYGSSDGCTCMTKEQYQYLNTRGGNRTLSSVF